ncbi:MAG: response regulator [Anaerolineae bacterium]|nr:response regulator [Anaerolineae bacterium]
MNRAGANQSGEGEIISILLVDDIPETRENIKKLLAFEPDFKVIGSVGTGREGVAMAKELRPNIIIMDINMPDMDGIQATTLITEAVPTAAVIMMSVQNDPDYLRRAMLAGARNFLTKPILPDELYNTIRTVHIRNKPIAAQYTAMQSAVPLETQRKPSAEGVGNRAGHIIVVYSPQGGAGCTTVATNLASGLMKEGIRVLLVDADLQFGDVSVFLNLQSQSTMVDLVGNVEDLDTELFDNIVVTHDSGLKVLMGPARPEYAEVIQSNPNAVAQILEKIAGNYDFIIVDTSRHLDETLLALFDAATKIVLIGMPTLASVKNLRFVLDLFDQLTYPPDKTMMILNRVPTDRNRQKLLISTDRIEKFLKRSIEVEIPEDEITALTAMSKGVLIVAQRDRSRSPVKELIQLAELLHTRLMGNKDHVEEDEADKKGQQRKTGFGLLSRKN